MLNPKHILDPGRRRSDRTRRSHHQEVPKMTGLFSLTTRKPLAVLLSVLCLASVGGTAAAVALDAPAAYAGVNDPSV